jgi:putative transposase
MAIREEVIKELLKDYKSPEDILGENGLLKQLTKSIVETALESEMTEHLGYAKNSRQENNSENSRNGKSKKVLKTDHGNIPIEVPRDRESEFEPQIIQKRQTRFDGFDDKIISMYARGMTTRDIAAHLKEIYRVDISADFISKVTDAVIEKVKEWQNRALDRIYPIVYLDCLVVKVRDEGRIVNKSVFIAIGVTMDGLKDVLGLWIEKNEGAKFWLSVITELKNRGIEDIYIACVDGLKGFPEAINSVFPKTEIQLCIVHMVRNSLKYVSYKVRKEMAKDLKMIYQSVNAEMAEKSLNDFAKKWDNKYPMISKSWKSNWDKIIPFLNFPDDIRRVIYTTNAIESLNMTLRKVVKNRASFPNDDAVFKLLYLALQRISKKWTMPIKEWGCALNQFAILYGNRVPE